MNKPSGKKKRPANDRNGAIPILRVKKGANRKELYAAARRAFTAADLQKFTEIEEGVPAEQVVADLEAMCREETPKGKHKK
jgi:hypothetical protein